MLIISFSKTSLIAIILSPILFTSTTFSFRSLSTIIPTPFLLLASPVYQSLKPSISLAFFPFHLVSCRQAILTLLLFIVSTNSILLPVKVPMFQVAKRILLSWTNFFTHTRPWCGNPCIFFIASGRRCNAPCQFFTTFGG